MRFPWPPFEPDRSRYAVDGSANVVNALPVRDGWGPMPSLDVFSAALASTCTGAVRARTYAGTVRTFAFTATAAYELDATDFTWDDVSNAGGAYAATEPWDFHLYGETLIATTITEAPQFIDIGSGTVFDDLPGTPPNARFVGGAGEQVVLGSLANAPNAIHVSAIGDAGYWTRGQRGSSRQDFGDGGAVQGIGSSERGAIIFQRDKLRQIALIQGDYAFQTSIINPARGVLAPYTICQIAPGVYFYYSSDGFSLGAEGRPIGAEKVDRWFADEADPSDIANIRSSADPFRKIVWTRAKRVDGTYFLLGYNWQLDRWCYSDANVSQLAVLATPGVTWDGLDTLYATIDDVDATFDSSLFTGGLDRFAAFDSSNKIGFFTGAPMAATIDSAEMELTPGRRTFVQEVQAITDCSNFTLRIGASDKFGTVPGLGTVVTPYSGTGIAHFRSAGRIHRLRMETASAATWEHTTGFEIRAKPEGRR
jgi:hypothetical protein